MQRASWHFPHMRRSFLSRRTDESCFKQRTPLSKGLYPLPQRKNGHIYIPQGSPGVKYGQSWEKVRLGHLNPSIVRPFSFGWYILSIYIFYVELLIHCLISIGLLLACPSWLTDLCQIEPVVMTWNIINMIYTEIYSCEISVSYWSTWLWIYESLVRMNGISVSQLSYNTMTNLEL